MAGSITWREYETDWGKKYSIRVDKSNAGKLAAFTSEILCKPRTETLELPPKGLVLRRLHCFSQDGLNLKRSFIIGNPKVIRLANLSIGQEYIYQSAPSDGDPYLSAWIITGYTGERFTCPVYYSQLDTGLDDGSIYG